MAHIGTWLKLCFFSLENDAISVCRPYERKIYGIIALVDIYVGNLCGKQITMGLYLMNRITVDPTIHFGKPCIAGTRITVQNVLELINEGIPFPTIVKSYYPSLTLEDIHACMQYAIALVASEEINLTPVAA
ncbi:MAG: DUF433 domain-containing protein [Caldilineaceae bacterium]